jgi:micrococcal nuclease
MKFSVRHCCVSIVIAGLFFCSMSYAELKERAFYRVARVIDGDTIKLRSGELVRLIGIDTPELRNNAKFKRDLQERHLTKAAEAAMGRRSYQFTKRLVEGKKIHLKFDKTRYDDYHRVLAYVFLSNGLFVNAQLVKEGYAYPYNVKPDTQYSLLFRRLYNEAKDHRRGLWKKEASVKKGLRWFKN